MYVNVIEYYRKCGYHLLTGLQISRVLNAKCCNYSTFIGLAWPGLLAQTF